LPVRAGENQKDRTARIIPLKELLVANIRGSLLGFCSRRRIRTADRLRQRGQFAFGARGWPGTRDGGTRALGAGRWRLVRQLLAESLMVSFAGGAAGMLLGFGAYQRGCFGARGKLPRIEMIRVDGWVFAFTLLLSLMTGIVFGLAPAFEATGRDVRESLNQGGRSVTRGHDRMRSALAISEIALALILLTGRVCC